MRSDKNLLFTVTININKILVLASKNNNNRRHEHLTKIMYGLFAFF